LAGVQFVAVAKSPLAEKSTRLADNWRSVHTQALLILC
jgi:hypothetical protein